MESTRSYTGNNFLKKNSNISNGRKREAGK